MWSVDAVSFPLVDRALLLFTLSFALCTLYYSCLLWPFPFPFTLGVRTLRTQSAPGTQSRAVKRSGAHGMRANVKF